MPASVQTILNSRPGLRSALVRLLATGLLFFCMPVFAQVPASQQFSLREGLPQSEISALFQDSRRVVWAGTRGGGLVEFTGYTSRVLGVKEGLESGFVADINENNRRELLAGITYSGVFRWDGGRFHRIFRCDSATGEVRRLLRNKGPVFGVFSRKVYLLGSGPSDSRRIFSFPREISDVRAAGIAANRWLLISEDSGLWVIDTRKPAESRFFGLNNQLSGKLIAGISVLNARSAYLVSADGFSTFLDFGGGRWQPGLWEKLPSFRLLDGEEINGIWFGLGADVKWISTSFRRVLSRSGEDAGPLQPGDRTVNRVSRLLQDKNGALWVGTSGAGLLIIPARTGYSYENYPELKDSRFRAVWVERDGTLLAGGAKTGLIVLRPESEPVKSNPAVLFPGLNLFCLLSDENTIYLGTESGLTLVARRDFRLLKTIPLPARPVVLRATPDGKVLVGTFGEGVWLFSNGEVRRIPSAKAGSFYSYGFEPRGAGQFLIPTNDGMYSLDLNTERIRPFPVPDSVRRELFLSTRDIYGNFWFANPNGLSCLTPRGWRNLPVSAGLSSNLFYTLNADSSGQIWLGSNNGLDRITVAPDGGWKEIENFGPEEGYRGFEANMRASFVRSGRLYICTVQGLFAMPEKSSLPDPPPPVPEISGMRASFRSQQWTDTIPGLQQKGYLTGASGVVIGKSPLLLSFSFLAVQPLNPGKLLYSYRFEGTGESWSIPSRERECILVNPAPGTYTLLVRSTYDGLQFSQPCEFRFEVAAPWYLQARWLVPGFLFLAGLLVLLGRSVLPGFTGNRFLDRELDIPEKTTQLILLIFAIFYPITQLIASRVEDHVFFSPLCLLVVSGLLAVIFLISWLLPAGKRNVPFLMTAAFLILAGDTVYSLFQSRVAPYHAVALLYVSVLSFLVFTRLWQLLTYSVVLVLVTLGCYLFVPDPVYSPLLLLLGAVGLSLILIIIHIGRRSAEERFLFASKVVNSGPVLVLGFGADGTLRFSGQNVFQLLGYSTWEVGGRAWWSQIMVRNEDVLMLMSRIQNRQESEMKVRLRHKKGEIRIFSFTGRQLNADTMVLMGQDITDRETLESRFQNLVENAPDAIYQTDYYGRLVYANPRTSFILGLPNSELIGRSYIDFIEPRYREEVVEFYRKQTTERTPSTYHEFPVVTRGGFTRWLGFHVSVLDGEGGRRVEGFLAIGRDITERLEAEQLIQHQHKNITDSLAYADRIKSAILPGDSELRSLFTHFAWYSKPRDGIGGDFYWMTRAGNKYIFALGDCTGHGVPGALMTTIAVGLLREIINEEQTLNLEDILGFFNRSLSRLMHTHSEIGNPDFVELALLEMDFEQNQITFLSSGIALYRFRNGEKDVFREGSRGLNLVTDYRGMSRRFSILPGDVFYLFTDGMFDQPGGPFNKRLTRKRFLEIVAASNQMSLRQGMEEIRKGVEDWQGNFPQIDDRLIFSFRF